MILSGNRDALNPVLEAIHTLADQLVLGHEERPVREMTLSLVLAASAILCSARRWPGRSASLPARPRARRAQFIACHSEQERNFP